MPSAKLKRKRKKLAHARKKGIPVLVPFPQKVEERQDEEHLTEQQEAAEQPAEGAPAEGSIGGFDYSAFPWRERVTPVVLLVLITFFVYIQVIHHPFVNYDDGEYVGENVDIQHGINGPMMHWALTSTEHANWHPVTWLSHALDWQLFGPDPSGHHLTSLLLHVVNVVLLFLFLTKVTNSTVRSLLAAALFAIHPIGVESVAWVSERKSVLCAAFFLLALIAYAGYARRPNVGRYLAVVLLFALGLASKPMLVTFPFVLLLLDCWPLQRIQGLSEPSQAFPSPQLPAWKIALEKLPLLALSAADSVVTMIAQQKVHAIRAGAAFPLSLRIENAVFSYPAYMWRAVWPTRLAVLYPYPYGGLPTFRVVLSALLLIACSVWVWRERARPYLLVGWLWFLGMLVPVLGLVQVGEQGMADRYAYLPMIGLFIAAVWGLFDLAQKVESGQRRYAAAAGGVVLIVFTFLCVRQVGFWRSNLDLWAHAAAVTENNNVAEDVVGSEILVEAMNHGQSASPEAQVHFQNAIRMDPKDSEALVNIGADLQLHGQVPEALEKYRMALQYVKEDSMRAKALTNMGWAYEQIGQYAAAREYYRKAMNVGWKGAQSTAFMGYARTFTDEQIAALGATLSAHPTAAGFFQLGQLQDAGGYTAAAVPSYQRALELDPKLEQARTALDRDAKLRR